MAVGLISLRKAVLLTLAVHLAIQSCGLILREVLPPSLAAIQPVVVAAADELLENKQNKGTFVDYFNCDSSDDFDHHHQLSEVTRVAITGCDYDHDHQKHCHLKNGTSVDFLVEFLPEKNYREVVLNINLQWPIFYPLISRERVCATELACPLVAGQKSTILLPNITVTVPSYVPQMMLENIQLNGTIVEVDEEDKDEDDDDDEEEGKTGDTVSCFVFYVSVDKGQVL